MKKLYFLAALAVLAVAALAADITGQTIRYRLGAALSVDPTVTIRDEDGKWSMTQGQMGKLAVLQAGSATVGASLTNKVTFTTAFSAAPVVVLTAGTNDLPHLISVTSSNFVIGVAGTNAAVRWMAFGQP